MEFCQSEKVGTLPLLVSVSVQYPLLVSVSVQYPLLVSVSVQYEHLHTVLYNLFLPPATKLRQGNVLLLSVILFGGVSVRETPPYSNVRAVRILLECILVYL